MNIKILLIQVIIIGLAACSSIDASLPISNIIITKQGETLPSRPEMKVVCKGFIVNQKQINDFYLYSSKSKETENNILKEFSPCYSQGTTYLYGEKYNWTLSVGGVATFFNEQKEFIKICGIKCCKKIQGVC